MKDFFSGILSVCLTGSSSSTVVTLLYWHINCWKRHDSLCLVNAEIGELRIKNIIRQYFTFIIICRNLS